MFFKNKNKGERVSIICDIGSGSVGAGLVAFPPDKEPIIVYSLRSPIIFQEEIDFSLFKRSMLSSLEAVVSKVLSEGPKHLEKYHIKDKKIDNAFVVFASPWYMAHTKTISIKSPTPIEFTKKFVESKLSEEALKFSDSHRFQQEDSLENDLELIEHQLIDVKLNGYSLSNPYGKKSEEVNMTLFMSVVSKSLKNDVSKQLDNFLHIGKEDVSFHTFAISSYSFIRDHFDHIDDYLIMDVSSEVTDVFVSDDGKLTSSTSYPYGTNSIVRNMVSSLGVSMNDSKSALSMLRSGDLRKEEKDKVYKVIEASKNKWTKLFKEVLQDLSFDLHPQKIFLISEKPFEFLFSGFIKDAIKSNEFLSKAEIVVINNAFFSKSVNTKENSDMYIASEAYYADKLFKSQL